LLKVSACTKASEVIVHVVQKQQLGSTEDWVLHEVICASELGQWMYTVFRNNTVAFCVSLQHCQCSLDDGEFASSNIRFVIFVI